MNYIQDASSNNKRLLLDFFFHFFHVWCCVFLNVSICGRGGPRYHPPCFPHIYWSRGSQPDPELTDTVSLAYQLALDSPCFCFLRLELQVGYHAKETMVFLVN